MSINRKDRRAAKSVAAKVKADKSNANPATPVANTAAERIAAMGDNIRPFYTDINTVVESIHSTEVNHKAVSDNQSLDLLVTVFAAREQFSLSDFVKGTKLTPSAKAVQSIWLQTYVPAYHDALRASEKKAEGKDYYSRQASQDKIDSEAAAAESIRVMFERVFMAAYWLEYIKAQNIGTAKKGRTRGLTYEYPTEEKTTVDGVDTIKTVFVPGIDSVTELTASGRAKVQAVKTAEGTAKGGAKGKGSKKKAAAKTAAKAADPTLKLETRKAVLDTASSVAQAFADTTGADNIKTLAESPQTEVLLVNAIAIRFGKRNKLGKLTSVDIGEVFTWLRTQTYFDGVVWTGHATTAELIPAVKTPVPAAQPAAVASPAKKSGRK